MIRIRKQEGSPRPWSTDPVFQDTYFCNVHREDDKVTRWIRQNYTQFSVNGRFEYNIILARMLNRIDTLKFIGYMDHHDPVYLKNKLRQIEGPVWGNAYVVTTHGIPMDKIDYLADNVMAAAWRNMADYRAACGHPYKGGAPLLKTAHTALQAVEGLGSFMAAQVVADLKNTHGYPLTHASDWWTFVAKGPGSQRGLNWFHRGTSVGNGRYGFMWDFHEAADYIREKLPELEICNQDIQNCLCEFDKYMRVKTGSGRSKRGYLGR